MLADGRWRTRKRNRTSGAFSRSHSDDGATSNQPIERRLVTGEQILIRGGCGSPTLQGPPAFGTYADTTIAASGDRSRMEATLTTHVTEAYDPSRLPSVARTVHARSTK